MNSLNTFNQSKFNISEYEKFYNLKLNLQRLYSTNVQFRFDENGLLHIKFVNLKVSITGNIKFRIGFISPLYRGHFNAELTNLRWEHTISVSSSKIFGKYKINFRPISESDIDYIPKIKIKTIKNSDRISNLLQNELEKKFKKYYLSNFKEYLRKLIKTIFNSLENNLNKA